MRHSIFYLDDEIFMLQLFQEMFGNEYDLRTASTLDATRRMLEERPADIIISDQRMPEIDGTDFLREVARLYPRSLRIMVSGYISAGELMGELSTGIVNMFVPKPWTEEYMRHVLERACLTLDSPNPPLRADSERRIAPRHKIRLEASVLMIAEQEGTGGDVQSLLPLTGYTYDISESGVGLTVTQEDMQSLLALGETYTLRLVLPLPAGAVELTVTPVRHQKLGTYEGEGADYLIGAQIIDMSGRDRVRFIEFIRNSTDRTQS